MTRLGEFELIDRYFTRPSRRAALGVGDDCALLRPRPGQLLAVSSDMLIEGRHFVSTVAPQRLGHKVLAVNLSDLAACGAQPLAFTLALALPQAESSFLEAFAAGLFGLADAHDCELVGGDTTRGPLAVCVTVFGEVPDGQALLRSGASPGDAIYVSGSLGDARLALEALRGTLQLERSDLETTRAALETPDPRVALGVALRGVATSAIDLSDGFVGDLGHILRRSAAGATVDVDRLPRSDAMRRQPIAVQRQCTLAGGDDYELVFTAPEAAATAVIDAARRAGTSVSRVGRIEAAPGLRLVDADGTAIADEFRTFDHFLS
jgi:thiamine-monophosphate kinase